MISKLAKKTSHVIHINSSFCTGCGNCIQFCPKSVLAREIHLNQRGIYAPVIVSLDACTGCRLCEMYCGNFAIAVSIIPMDKP